MKISDEIRDWCDFYDGGGLRVAGHYYDDTPNVSISYCPNCGARVVRDNDRDSK